MASQKTSRKAKVKSGCRTCKTRKVKCDEAYPVCQRCASTGRICDGYGVWGGGGNQYPRRLHARTSDELTALPTPASISLLIASMDEKEHFDWFKRRTASKLPGTYVSEFWTTLVFQASFSEPAVLHAVLALSSIHKEGVLNSGRLEEGGSTVVPGKPEQFALEHYLKSISHLHPHFLAKDRASFRVALIACVVFICLDFFRGHLTAAQVHLRNGLKLLEEMQVRSNSNGRILPSASGRESIDTWIAEIFTRLHIQVELIKQPYQQPLLFLLVPVPIAPSSTFRFFKEAWDELDRLLNRIFDLAKQARERKVESVLASHAPWLSARQQRLLSELDQWLGTFKASQTAMRGRELPSNEEKANLLMLSFHSMAVIMADVCLSPDDESVFDSCTSQFLNLLNLLTNLRLTGVDLSALPPPPSRHLIHISRSVTDVACTPPLYYVAIKCRVHRIRLQAIRLLEDTTHREGIWDATIVAPVARKIMELEEGDFYKDLDPNEEFLLFDFPRAQDLLLPPLPNSHMLRDAEMVLSGDPVDKVSLLCTQKKDGKDSRECLGEYHVTTQSWVSEGIKRH